MNEKLSWRTLMETRTEKRNKMQTPTLVAIIVGLHIMAVGSVVFIQGCGTARTRGPSVEPPPAPVMPADPEVREARPVTPPPVFTPPTTVPEPAPRMPEADPQVYEVQRGDSLSTIARRHGVSTAELADLNKISDPNTIRIGQKLLLPAHARTVTPRAAAPAPAAPAAPTADGTTYVVQAGDSLSRIAARHGVTTAALSAANNISDPNMIRVGQTLVIPNGDAPAPGTERPAPTRPAPAPAPAPAEPEVETPAPAPSPADAAGAFPYSVRSGDTLETIARDFATLKDDIVRLNNLTGDETLRPGQTLLIPPMR